MKTPRFLYHYTVGSKLSLIAQSGQLNPAGFGLAKSSKERPVLWFSENDQWENTATKVISTDGILFKRPPLPELHALVGLYRFRLDVVKATSGPSTRLRLLHWPQIPRAARIDVSDVESMVLSGLKLKALPMQWWGTLEPVPLDFEQGAVTVESCTESTTTGNVWEPTPLSNALQAYQSRGRRIEHLKASETPAARGL